MVKVVVSVGSNSEDRMCQMRNALDWLALKLNDFRSSDIYETPAYGGGSTYLNAVVSGATEESCESLNSLFKKYELRSGRSPEVRSLGIVPIDVDLVIYGGEILRPVDYQRDFFKIGFNQLS